MISASRCLYLCSVLVFDQTIDNQFRSFVQYLKVRLNRGEGGTWSTRWRTVSHKTNAAELIVLVLPESEPVSVRTDQAQHHKYSLNVSEVTEIRK